MSQLALLQREWPEIACLDRSPAGKPEKHHERIRFASCVITQERVCLEFFAFTCPARCTWSIELSRFPGPALSYPALNYRLLLQS